jgi:hypothetical protein
MSPLHLDFVWVLVAAASPEPSSVAHEWLSVRMEPAVVRCQAGDVLTTAQVVDRLTLRLASAGIGVAAHDAPPLGAEPPWQLLVEGATDDVVITVTDPTGLEVVHRSLPASRSRANAVAHTIALVVAEGMAPVIERLVRALGGASNAAEEAVPVVSTPPTQSEETSPLPLRLGLRVQGGLAVPGDGKVGALGLFGGLALGGGQIGATLHVSADVYAPRSAQGADYELRLMSGAARLRAGVEARGARWAVGIDAGPGLRVTRESRRGERITTRDVTSLSASFGVGARLSSLFGDSWGAQLALDADRYYPYRRYTVDGRPVLNEGRALVVASAAVLVAW